MPILAREIDLYPENLFDIVEDQMADLSEDQPNHWWAIYTLSRREKEFMRRLHALSIPFYGPIVAKRSKTPSGRVYTAYEPLFRNYVFLYGDDEARYTSMTTNCVSSYVPVKDNAELTRELKQFHSLIGMDVPLLPEARLVPGQQVRIRSGRFRGFEGTIVRREREVRLLVAINFIQQGASLLLDDFEVEAI
jgi:transcription antitermination factor NusG